MDRKSLQKKLIPFNIFVAVLCLVAGITLLTAPLLDIDLSKNPEYIESVLDGAGGRISPDCETERVVAECIPKIHAGINFGLVQAAAFSDDPIAVASGEIAKTLYGENKRLAVAFVTDLGEAGAIPKVEPYLLDGQKLSEELDAAGKAADTEKAYSALGVAADRIAAAAGSADYAETIEKTLCEVYDKTVEICGDFSFEHLICSVYSEYAGLTGGAYVTGYGGLVAKLIKDGFRTQAQVAAINGVAKGICAGVYYFLLAVASAFFLQSLVAVARIFSADRRFRMWYTKLFGILPCLIFGILPEVAAIFAALTPALAAFAEFASLISTTAWVSGVCYLLLWVGVLFWAYPLKRQISDAENVLVV